MSVTAFSVWTGVVSLLSDQTLVMRLLPKYGYFAVLVAAFCEGEATLIAAGALCWAGYLDWRLTILAAALGGAAGDQIYFYGAHERAARLIQRSSRPRRLYPKARQFVLRHGTLAVLLSRFAAGLRITIPLVCATAGMSSRKYTPLNLISALPGHLSGWQLAIRLAPDYSHGHLPFSLDVAEAADAGRSSTCLLLLQIHLRGHLRQLPNA
jgi:membrane protein DedA with SNARE-associated domain